MTQPVEEVPHPEEVREAVEDAVGRGEKSEDEILEPKGSFGDSTYILKVKNF